MLGVYSEKAKLMVLEEEKNGKLEGVSIPFWGCESGPSIFTVIFHIWSAKKPKVVTYFGLRFRDFLLQNSFLSLDSQ